MFRAMTIVSATLLLIASACSSGSQPSTGDAENGSSEGDLSQSASAGGIDVKATWQASDAASDVDLTQYPADRFLFLEVKLDTHSGDLMSIDFPAAAEFRQGDKRFGPTGWIAAKDDAHHREGLLVVPREFAEGSVELVLQLGDDSLSLEWGSAPQAQFAPVPDELTRAGSYPPVAGVDLTSVRSPRTITRSV